jgi:ubiquinone/menaquinone biosynthesis C-methylase UbiE
MENRDVFGLAPAEYRQFRPRYPRALFEQLAALCPRRESALDCATGNGQAAVGLAELFARVAAFDSSETQIAHAIAHERIEYRVGTAEALPFDEPFDLVTVAQGAHWFDLPAFYGRLERVTRPDSVIAIWGYSFCAVNPAVDVLVARELLEPIGPYWAEGNRVIMDKYRGIAFPFDELPWPALESRHEWTREAYLGYLNTWSAVRRYAEAHGRDPVAEVDLALRPLWPDATPLPVVFELVGRVGRRGSG